MASILVHPDIFRRAQLRRTDWPPPMTICSLVNDPERSEPSTTPYCESELVMSLPCDAKVTSCLTLATPAPARRNGSTFDPAIGAVKRRPPLTKKVGCLAS